ncbi:Uncharacterized protein APZ42_027841 [Daphnia magna]|uniref:exodeoxyribonuclease III n=1 Tax=Daphnia magna TaxID=35525 RepID=A0A164R1B6_9CRUS|nr:Uncharacterized protein APZ42_027841 [Daphnia magna]
MIKIIALNINGIKERSKQEFLNKFLLQYNPDFLSLQETNINNFKKLHSAYLAIINNNIENKSSGTMIIYKKEIELIKIEKEESGRIIRAHFKNVTIVNMYAPTRNEAAANQHLFFLHVLPKFLKANDENTIILGVFNCIIDERDREGIKKKINPQLKNLIVRLKYIDAFRTVNPNINAYTFVSPNGKSRIDRIYIPSKQKRYIKNCININFAYSDHVAVMLELEESVCKPVNKNILRKLNTSVLEDPYFQEEIEIFILNAKSKIYEYQSIIDWWEKGIKEKFKKLSQTYCKNKTKEKNAMKKFHEKCLDQVKIEIDNGGRNLDDYYILKIASINIGGISSVERRQILLNFCRDGNLDIVGLQEVAFHSCSIIESCYHLLANVGPNKNGTAILIIHCLEYSRLLLEPDGRLISIDVKCFTFINIYAQSGKQAKNERNNFLRQTLPAYSVTTRLPFVLMGDFNCVDDIQDRAYIISSPSGGRLYQSVSYGHLVVCFDVSVSTT